MPRGPAMRPVYAFRVLLGEARRHSSRHVTCADGPGSRPARDHAATEGRFGGRPGAAGRRARLHTPDAVPRPV
ncbi:hypothetical protein [Streptomyces uncialis]|uniref:hypothetical protein n=1 Tax=Streptomyces uncialis TaxID=1048205 RepID=UPI003407F5A5